MKKYFYIFQVYEKQEENYLSNLTTVEVVAVNYEEAIKQIRPLLKSGDERAIRLNSIVPVEGRNL